MSYISPVHKSRSRKLANREKMSLAWREGIYLRRMLVMLVHKIAACNSDHLCTLSFHAHRYIFYNKRLGTRTERCSGTSSRRHPNRLNVSTMFSKTGNSRSASSLLHLTSAVVQRCQANMSSIGMKTDSGLKMFNARFISHI